MVASLLKTQQELDLPVPGTPIKISYILEGQRRLSQKIEPLLSSPSLAIFQSQNEGVEIQLRSLEIERVNNIEGQKTFSKKVSQWGSQLTIEKAH
jgi:hypothetical protein